ncbi:ATP-dependent RNA helicase RhlE [Hyphomicrobiales bacterium]|nr:ATP-dependent RNA helicase RhlE [Hyphomicrobiales bacterium]CAH1670113.1 ATP-dependent RNA helicase RhlE [Hyphomicrobiales bacterium]
MTTFKDLGLAQPLLKALEGEGYHTPTPIQAQSIPHLLEGHDLLGIAQTGTGKTAAFALPILHKLAANKQPRRRHACRALVLSPTRELASQIADSFRTYGQHLGLTIAVCFGGVGVRPQAMQLAQGVDVLVATPGRLIDHLDGRAVNLGSVEVFVLDEADQMLDMGFIHAIRRILPGLPKARQNLFFSATMPKEIGALAAEFLKDPVKVSVTPVATTAERVDQQVIFVETGHKRNLLAKTLREVVKGRTLVFARTKHGADRIVRHLEQDGVRSAAIHGNKSQGQREKALAEFRSGRTPILVATDIAARGIDVDGVTHVINFDLPNVPESYVHRIGRTARAGAEGSAISFCDAEERAYLRDIEKLTRQKIPATDGRADQSTALELFSAKPQTKRQGGNGGNNGGRGRPQGAHGGHHGGGRNGHGGEGRGAENRNHAGSGASQPHGHGDRRGPGPGAGAEAQRGNGHERGGHGHSGFASRSGGRDGAPNGAPGGRPRRPRYKGPASRSAQS